MRKEHELADCIKWGWIYHHTGIPTTEKKDGEVYIPHLKFYVSGFPTSPFGIEWMRFEEDCPMHPLIKKVPHIAFEVKDEAEFDRALYAFILQNVTFLVLESVRSDKTSKRKLLSIFI